MKRLVVIAALAAWASSASATDLRFDEFDDQGYEQDAPIATDMFQDQGLLLSPFVVAACFGECISSPAYGYYGSIFGRFVLPGTDTQSAVTKLTFLGVSGLMRIDLFDLGGKLVTTLKPLGLSYDPEFSGGFLLPRYSYSGPTAIGSFNAVLNFDGIARLTFGSATGSAPVPEPASWAMMLAGFAAVGGALRARRNVRIRFA